MFSIIVKTYIVFLYPKIKSLNTLRIFVHKTVAGTFKSAVKWNEHIWNGILTFYQLDLIPTQKWNERYTENIVT